MIGSFGGTVGRKKQLKKWEREEVLDRLMRIAEEAKEATFTEKTGKDGENFLEYDSKCASIELKAVEYAVKLAGLDAEKPKEDLSIRFSSEAENFAL